MKYKKKLEKALALLRDYAELYDAGAICCDCRNPGRKNPKEGCPPCEILKLRENVKSFLEEGLTHEQKQQE
jgi:hypothetical protein